MRFAHNVLYCVFRVVVAVNYVIFIFKGFLQKRGSVGPVKQLFKLKWPNYTSQDNLQNERNVELRQP